jgi:hypothetical protein
MTYSDSPQMGSTVLLVNPPCTSVSASEPGAGVVAHVHSPSCVDVQLMVPGHEIHVVSNVSWRPTHAEAVVAATKTAPRFVVYPK